MRIINIFFDFEAWWEAPYRSLIDVEGIINRILEILDKYEVKATFNTCGIVVKEFPDVVRSVAESGHEVASHGYFHENFFQLDYKEITDVFEKTEKVFMETLGTKPVGFRAPWLIHNESIYLVLRERGYLWSSNKAILEVEKLYAPHFIKVQNLLTTLFKIERSLLGAQQRFTYRLKKRHPILKNEVVEIPLLSSQDGELLGEVSPFQRSLDRYIQYTYSALVNQYKRSKLFFNLNFHPWLIGSANRLTLLDKILFYLTCRKSECTFVTAENLAQAAKYNGFAKLLDKEA